MKSSSLRRLLLIFDASATRELVTSELKMTMKSVV